MKSFIRKLFALQEEDRTESADPLGHERRTMIQGIVDLSETTVKEVVVPRIDVVFISHDTSQKDLLSLIVNNGYSRYPVYRDTIDNVIGILYVKDLFSYVQENKPIKLEQIIRKPFFIPESKKLDSLLREFKRRKVHIAIAVDEYGGVSGIIALEDIIEEIVGDIQDEFDDEKEDIIKIGEHAYLCDARAEIEDINQAAGLSLPEEPFETLGGFVFDLFGKIPVTFEKITYGNVDIIVQSIEGQKINTVKLVIREPDAN